MKLFDTSQSLPDVPIQWLDQSLLNEYREECHPVVFSNLRKVLRYRCKDECWHEAHTHWVKVLKENPNAPQPFPSGHCMFVSPESYDSVPWMGQEN